MTSHVAIGCFASICRDRLGDELVSFTHRFPRIGVGLHEMPRGALLKGLEVGEVALAIMPGPLDGRFDAIRIWTDRVVAAVPRSHPLAGRRSVHPAELANEVFLVPRFQRGWDMHRFLAGQIMPDRRSATALYDGGHQALLALVGQGRGMALLCESHVAEEHPDVVLLPIDAPSARFPVHVHWRRDAQDPPLTALLDLLVADAVPDPV